MKLIAALTLAAGLLLAAPAVQADDPKPADKPADAKPAQGDAPKAPEAPKGIPVPSDLPVVKKTELEGGLIAEDLKIGEGYEVKPGGAVVAHYHGTLKSDGKVFDSSFERGQPIGFPLSGVIPGWQKGVPGMKVGGIRRLTIPYALAYGENGQPPTIPPKADLVFVIQLVDALQVEETALGTGEEVSGRAVVATAHTITDDKGTVVHKSTREQPFLWLPGENSFMGTATEGAKVGGKRKVRVPADFNRAGMQVPGAPSFPPNAAITIEFEIVAVRNLPGAGRR